MCVLTDTRELRGLLTYRLMWPFSGNQTHWPLLGRRSVPELPYQAKCPGYTGEVRTVTSLFQTTLIYPFTGV